MNNLVIKKVYLFICVLVFSIASFSVFWYSFDISDYNYSTYLLDLHFSFLDDWSLWDTGFEDVSFQDSMDLIQQMQYYANYDIVLDLEYGLGKKYHINNYLLLVSKLLFQADAELSYINNLLDIAQEDYDYCLENKKLSDSDFFQGFDDYNVSLMENAYNESLKNDICISNNKIKINAWKVIYKKLVFFYSILEKRYKNISLNKDKLIQDYTFSQEN